MAALTVLGGRVFQEYIQPCVQFGKAFIHL